MPTIVATPNAPNANSYLTQVEANAYFAERVPLATPWPATDQSVQLIMAQRLLSALTRARRVRQSGKDGIYYIVTPTWTGTPSTATQALAWGRVGMFDENGNEIDDDVIPQGQKFAQAELAGLLSLDDRTLENQVLAQGLSSLRAGPVSLSFKDSFIASSQTLPDSVLNHLLPSWLTEEYVEYGDVLPALFDVVSD